MSDSKYLSPSRREKLATMPLAVLLPRLGELSQLSAYADDLEQRLEIIQTQDATQDDVRRGVGEEAMILQVLSWLSMGQEGGES